MGADFNTFEIAADRCVRSGDHRTALAIYFFMADGDVSLDAGHLAERIAACYYALGDLHAAKYWFGRAVEENPEVYSQFKALREEMGDLGVVDLVSGS